MSSDESSLPAVATDFVHTVTDENAFANTTRIDHPLTSGMVPRASYNVSVFDAGFDGQDDDIELDAQVEQLVDQFNHPVGVFYDARAGQWTIYNQDGSTVPEGTRFIVERRR